MSGAKSIYIISKCKKLVPGWTLPGFKEEALAVHAEVCALLAAGDRTGLRQVRCWGRHGLVAEAGPRLSALEGP